jgi:hypothetical protein
MARVRKRALRRFVFGAPTRKKRRASGVAARAKNAPKHCKVGLSHCMKGGGRGKAGPCMRKYWFCIKAA